MEKIAIETLAVNESETASVTQATIWILEKIDGYPHNRVINLHTKRVKTGYVVLNPQGFIFNCNLN